MILRSGCLLTELREDAGRSSSAWQAIRAQKSRGLLWRPPVAMKAIKGLKFGETYINRENFEAMQGFHAGWRKSGIGGADGKHGLHEYLQTQVVYLQS